MSKLDELKATVLATYDAAYAAANEVDAAATRAYKAAYFTAYAAYAAHKKELDKCQNLRS